MSLPCTICAAPAVVRINKMLEVYDLCIRCYRIWLHRKWSEYDDLS